MLGKFFLGFSFVLFSKLGISLALSPALKVKIRYPSLRCLATSTHAPHPHPLSIAQLYCQRTIPCLHYCDYKTLVRAEPYDKEAYFPFPA